MISVLYRSIFASTLLVWLGTSAAGQSITFQTRWFRYDISASGRSERLVDLRDKKNYLAETPTPFAFVVQGGREHVASSVRREGDRLQVTFAGTKAKATIHVEQRPEWLVFELESLADGEDVEEIAFPNIETAIQGRKVAVQAVCVSTDHFAISCQTLNMRTDAQVKLAGRPVWLRGRAYRRFGLVGARVALVAVPPDQLLRVIEALELAEPEVPHMTLDGVWARRSPDGRKSYLFIDMTEANADEVIDIARQLNFGYILIYAPTWARTRGSYEINTRSFPHGMDGLRAVAQKAHAAGIKVGIHCLTGFVSKSDPLVAPVPDRRLAKDARLTLAADVDEKAKVIPTVESPKELPSDVGYGPEPQGFDVQIDDEIIGYRSLATDAPFGLARCVRGLHGTRPAPHKKGSPVWHLLQRYNHYLADCDTDLADRIARRYAQLINDCQLDMIYFDGAGSYLALGRKWTWRYVPRIPLLSQRLWQREVRVGGSCSGPLYWHMQAFKTCNDFVEIGVKAFFDNVKIQQGLGAEANFVPIDFGWWGLHRWAPHRRATTPDEIEYVCQKAMAFDACWSLETTLATIRACGRWPDIKQTIARYERLRLENRFSNDVKKVVRQPGAEFRLLGDEQHGWRLAPVRYGPPHLVLDEATASWTVDNPFGQQPLQCRVYALPTVASYDDADNPVLIDQRDVARYVKHRASPGCQSRLQASGERTPDGEACVALSATSKLRHAGGWCEHRADLRGLSGRAGPPALIEGLPEEIATSGRWARPLGVWVHGDGQGEVLNIQLRAANGGYRDHYIDIDFKGWRWCELTRPETERVFHFHAGYSQKHAVRHFRYDRIASLYLRYNSIPAGATVRCLVGPVKALRERWRPLKNPALTINGQRIVFPCQLETEQYLELDETGMVRLFDREGVEISRVKPLGNPPTLQPGENRVDFAAEAGPALGHRAEVIIIRQGDPL